MKSTRTRLSALALTVVTVAASLTFTAASAGAAPGDQVVWSDPATARAGAAYTRAITLRHNGEANGTVIATFERHTDVDGNRPAFPIYRSTNFGQSWQFVTDVIDTPFGAGNRYQPALYELPAASGNLPEGTLLLVGNSIPNDLSSTRLVMYKSLDAGNTWTFVSTIDTGGPSVYAPEPTSTSSPVWEPQLLLTPSGLVVYYSDEKQKANNILQALVHRVSTDGGQTWGPVVNDVAVPDRNTRPGMMTVIKLPNGQYFGAYEVVGLPDVPVYAKFSPDGVNWGNPADIGFKLQTASGQSLFGSPWVEWVPTGGPNGTIIVTGTRMNGVTPAKSNFLANTNLGQGNWSLFPTPVDTPDGTNGGYSQSVTTSLDNRYLMQFTSKPNAVGKHDVVSSVMPLDTAKYEAENQVLSSDVQVLNRSAASSGKEVGYINLSTSNVLFNSISAPRPGVYKIRVRYSNGTGSPANHQVSVNGGAAITVPYVSTGNWDAYDYVTFNATLNQGNNTIRFTKGTGQAEIDVIEQYTQGARYEAEEATITNAQRVPKLSGSGGEHVGYIDAANSSVLFPTVPADGTGTFAMRVTYSNGTATNSTHQVSVNGGAPQTVTFPPTGTWNTEKTVLVLVNLQSGNNTIRFTKGTGFAELDAIDVF